MSNLDNDRNPYGKKIKAVREEHHLTLANMADSLGLNGPKAYQRYETGESRPTLEFLEAIAQVFKMSLPELLNFGRGHVFNECHQANTFGPGSAIYETNSKLVSALEAQVKHLEGEVEFLRSELEKARRT